MTITPLSPAPNTAPVRRRYLTDAGDASPTATISATFDRQNLEHRIPDHWGDPIQGRQNQRDAGHSTLVLVWNRQITASTGAKST